MVNNGSLPECLSYIKAYRAQLRAHCLSWLISTPIWIASIFVSVRAAIAMSVVAIVFEWWSWIFIYSKYFKRWLKLRYSSAVRKSYPS